MKRKMTGKKRCFAFLAAVVMFVATVFGDLAGTLPEGGLFPGVGAETVEASSGTVKVYLSKARNRFGISAIGRPASEGLWNFTAGGKTVFCLNSGKTLNNGDTAKYTTYYAVNYSNQSMAKALTWYYTKSNKSSKNKALLQAYLWACGMSKSKTKTVYQAGKNLDSGYTMAKAEAFCNAISKTTPEGIIYAYNITKCPRGKSITGHQHLIGWAYGNTKATYESVTVSDSRSGSLSTSVEVSKRDSATSALIDEATFELYFDGTKVATVKTSGGKATYTYKRTYTVSASSTKTYVTNYSLLSSEAKKKVTASGYYQDKASAQAAAKAEVKASLDTKENAEKSKSHTWKAVETKAPSDHLLADPSTQSATEAGSSSTSRKVSFTFYDKPVYGSISISKVNADTGTKEVGGVYTSLAATYGIYAAGTIVDTAHKTAYSAGDLVATVKLDKNGNGSATGLYLGSYYVQEIEAPTGMTLSTEKYPVTLSKSGNSASVSTPVTVKEKPVIAQLEIHKKAGDEPEVGAVFQLINENGDVIAEMETDDDGYAIASNIPYGTYTLHQTVGYDNYFFAPDQIVVVNAQTNGQTIEFELTDDVMFPSIEITKTATKADEDAGVYEKKPEAGAVFVILDGNGKQVGDELVTDENGYAKSSPIEKAGTYTVHQVSGDPEFGMVEDFTVTVTDEDILATKSYSYTIDDSYIGYKVMIHKLKVGVDEKTTSDEAGAEFYILDASKAAPSEADLSSADARADYVSSLDTSAVLGHIVTDDEGQAACLIDNSDMPEGGVLILQVSGAKGYKLADPVYTADYEYTDANGMKVYSFEIEDPFDNYAYLAIEKTEESGEDEYSPEAGAVFEIYDTDGNIVETLTTDKSGYAETGKLAYGLYTIHQVSGQQGHILLEDKDIVLSAENYHETVVYECENPMGEILLRLVKASSETGTPVNWAVYEVMDKTGAVVATLTTGAGGTDGEAYCALPFGSYTLKEVEPADGYKIDTQEYTFELNEDVLTFEPGDDGTVQAYYTMYVTDAPIWGKITVDKTGNVLTGYYEHGESRSFLYDPGDISGAEYGLYAREDILDDAGDVVYAAGTLIGSGFTGTDGTLTFTRTLADGTTTDEMYMGKYYVKELSTPEGWILDTEEYEITLTYDTKAHDLNDTGDSTDIPDVEDAVDAYPVDSGKYTLIPGPDLNEQLSGVTKVTFTDETASGSTTDVSADGDGSVVLWKSGSEAYISTQTDKQEVLFNMDSSYMFSGLSKLSEIDFTNVNTEKVLSMRGMFYKCTSLYTLDLSKFSTSNVTDMSYMFYGCTNLETIYVLNDEYVLDNVETDSTIKARVIPNRTFALGEELTVDDFTFSTIEDNVIEEVFDPAGSVTITPSTASTEGTMTIGFTFSGSYASYGTIYTDITVVDPDSIEVEEKYVDEIDYTLPVTDWIQTCEIRIRKTDGNGNVVEGAVFELRALVDIVNQKGETVIHKGDVIDSKTSASDDFEYLVFDNLPTKVYAASDVQYMYEVVEVSAPAGYTPSSTVLKFTGDVEDNTTQNFIYDETVTNTPNTFLSLTKVWDNNGLEIPDSVQVEVQDYSGNVLKTVTLTAKDGWYAEVKDLPASGEYKFVELNVPDGYRVSYDYDANCGAATITNTGTPDTKSLAVKKVWEDENNADSVRPSSVTVDLYAGDEVIQTITLNKDNGWSAAVTGLPVLDDDGAEIKYEFREREDGLISGNALTGYSIRYTTSGQETTITNVHNDTPVSLSVRKVWDDGDDKDGIRPDSIKVDLLANGKTVQTLTLSEDNGWEETITGLPRFDNGGEIEYSFKEAEDGVVTGDEETGYAPSYSVSSNGQVTTITNTHKPGQPEGRITVVKKVSADGLVFLTGDEITFTFDLSGTDVDGNKVSLTKDVTFTKAEVEENTVDGYVTLPVVFDGLVLGTYAVEEEGTVGYDLESITGVSGNGTLSADGTTVTFKLDEDSCEGGATFTNAAHPGSIRIVKYDSSGKELLEGVTFELKDADGNVVATAVTDANGEAIFDGLLPGDYILTETATVPGNTLLAEQVEITIPFIMTKAEARAQHADTSKAEYSPDDGTYLFYDLTYEVTNSVTFKIPTTGGVTWYLPLVAGFLLLAAAAAWLLKKRGLPAWLR